MYEVKMIFVLIQIGSNLWVNPMQVEAVKADNFGDCKTTVVIANSDVRVCTDWPLARVLKALAPASVSKAMEGK